MQVTGLNNNENQCPAMIYLLKFKQKVTTTWYAKINNVP